MKIDLSGKIALVTGGAGELGRVISRTLARCGADVVVHYFKSREKAESLVEEIRQSGQRGLAVHADISSPEDIHRMSHEVREKFGIPAIIVTNAVSQYEWKHILDQDIADYQNQFETTVLQNVLMAKAFLPDMIQAGWGRVIGINTECAMQNFESQSAYVAGKRGMDGILRVLAREVGSHKITVNQVAPGWIVSEGRPDDESAGPQQYKERVPLKRRGTEQDVANAVAFLSSDLAGFITGAYIPVCGGNVMPAI